MWPLFDLLTFSFTVKSTRFIDFTAAIIFFSTKSIQNNCFSMKYLKQLLFLEKEKLYQYFTIAQVFRSVQRINVVIFQLWMNYIASIG
ncbi:hypothetical protein FPG59_09450 [Flavobacterium sp. FPG59]|nr:hypothetical protein FPG59_09450 [Flavobacterium sp. FPG59]